MMGVKIRVSPATWNILRNLCVRWSVIEPVQLPSNASNQLVELIIEWWVGGGKGGSVVGNAILISFPIGLISDCVVYQCK